MSFETHLLAADRAGIETAAGIWAGGGLVAFPTETVYGLGADARDDRAVARIFEAKARPGFNPLIVHVPDVAAAKALVEWPEAADRLAAAFWPGALTLVLPLREGAGISKLVTAGLSTLAVRVPGNDLARDLLRAFGGPVAAPSANPSGRISPTEARHVTAGLGGRIEAVLDGGPCAVGLESTIVGLEGAPILLRPGGIPAEAIEAALGVPLLRHQEGDALSAPGQMQSHYAPGGTVRLEASEARDGEVLLGFGPMECDLNLSPAGDLLEAAANLFACLHRLDEAGAKAIAVAPIPDRGIGRAINDRLRRAAAPRDE